MAARPADGVTIHAMREVGIDGAGDGDMDEADSRALPRARAVNVQAGRYPGRVGIGRRPGPIQASVFDILANARATAGRILRRLLARMGQARAVKGRIGSIRKAGTKASREAAPG